MPNVPSIRARVLLLVLGVTLPLVALAGYLTRVRYLDGVEAARQEAMGIAEATAASAGQFLDDVGATVERLASDPRVRSLDPDRCLDALAGIPGIFPQFANAFVSTVEGVVTCSAAGTPEGTPAPFDRDWFSEALSTGRLVVGGPILGRLTGRWAVVVAYPVRDDDGHIVAVAGLAVDLIRFQGMLRKVAAPPGSLITIDDHGVVVARSVDADRWIGRPIPGMNPSFVPPQRGFRRTTGADGVARLWAVRRVSPGPWTVYVGIPESWILAGVWRTLLLNLAIAGVAAALMLALATFTYRRIAGALEDLTVGMRSAGASDAEPIPEEGPQEIAQVARVFNQTLEARDHAEARARETAERHALILRTTNDAVWEWDLASDRVRRNRRFVELFGDGGGPAHPAMAFWQQCIHPEDFDHVQESIWTCVEQGRDTWSHEYRMARPDGTWAYVLDRGYVLRDEDGRPVRLMGAMLDVTEDRRAREAVRQAKDRYRSIMQNAVFGICIVSLDGRVLEVNPALAAMLDCDDPADLLDACEEDFFVEPGVRDRQKQDALLNTLAQAVETRWRTRSGRVLTVRLFRSTFRHEHGETAFEVIAEDLTERRSLEAQFRQAQKLEAVGRLAGGVAHDFNNRLTVIRGQAQFIREDLPEGHDVIENVDAILESADRAAALTAQLLAFSRRQITNPRAIDLNECVEHLMPMLRTLIGEDVNLGMRAHEPLGTVLADPGQVEQILFNLVVNARDAMPRGGSIVIETDHVTLSAEETRTNMELAPGAYVALRVRDTGSGMTDEVLAQAFEPFYTTKPADRGTGLGLATVYGLATQNHGHARIESEPDRGTTVEILLPRTDHPAQREDPFVHAVPSTLGHETILVTEDEPAVREILSRTLRRGGYQVLEAGNGEEALDVWATQGEDVDLVITDVVMPGMRGTELAERIDGMRPGTRVILMSGYTEDIPIVVGHHETHRTFIRKPFSPHFLLRIVRDMLGPTPPDSLTHAGD